MEVSPPSDPAMLTREEIVHAIDKLDAGRLIAHLVAATWDQDDVIDVLVRLRQANKLILRYPDEKRAKRRAAFREQLECAFADQLGDDGAAALEMVFTLLDRVELGYTLILSGYRQSAFRQFPVERRFAAVLARAAQQTTFIDAEIKKSAAGQTVIIPGATVIQAEDGRTIHPDGAIGEFVTALGATLVMEGIEAELFDKAGPLALPPLPIVDENDIYVAGLAEVGAQFWRWWTDVEEMVRLLGGDIELLEGENLPLDTPAGAERVYRHIGPLEPWTVFAARQRLVERSHQTFTQLLFRTNLKDQVADFEAGLPLESGFVSLEEAHANLTLSDYLARHINQDQRLVEGLRFVEWVRGYSTLSALAHRRWEQGQGLLQVYERNELTAILTKVGLTAEKAERLMAVATFGRGRRDLFDAPLLTQADGRLMLFGPAAIGARVADVLTSVFSALRLNFDDKGKAFERRVMALLKEKGMAPQAFKFKRAFEDYEYDAVIAWDGLIFVFECKNRSLPAANATAIRDFLDDRKDVLHQVKRLIGALERWPEELTARFGPEAAGKTIVPVVLRNLPYAQQGPTDGVYFYDFSALTRFFESGQMNNGVQIDRGIEIQVPTFRLWAGDQPVAADLLAQLQDPIQLKLIENRTRIFPMYFSLDGKTLVHTEKYLLEAVDLEAMAVLAGREPGSMAQAIRLAEAHRANLSPPSER